MHDRLDAAIAFHEQFSWMTIDSLLFVFEEMLAETLALRICSPRVGVYVLLYRVREGETIHKSKPKTAPTWMLIEKLYLKAAESVHYVKYQEATAYNLQ